MPELWRRLEALSPERREWVLRKLRREKSLPPPGAAPEPVLRPVGREPPPPLSFAQERLWFLAQLEGDLPAYHQPLQFYVTGPLDPEALARSLREIVRRHEVLRTTFTVRSGRPRQLVHARSDRGVLRVDAAGLPRRRQLREARRLARENVRRPFDLERGPLLRAVVLRLGAREHALLLTLHHVVGDGWSLGVLQRELAALYTAAMAGQPSPLPELEIQYADFACWQRETLRGPRLRRLLDECRRRLEGIPALLDLPTDRPRRPATGYRGAVEPVRIRRPRGAELEASCRRYGVSLFMLLHGLFAALLGRWSGRRDIVLGSPVAGRHPHPTEPLIGCFVNTLVLRLAGPRRGEAAAEYLARVREADLDAFAAQDVPFEKLVEELQPERTPSRTPLVQVMLVLQNAPRADFALPGLELHALEAETVTAKFDLTLSVAETPGGLTGFLEYRTELFDSTTVRRLAGQLRELLAAVPAHPEAALDELEILSPAERHQLRTEWNDTRRTYPAERTMSELFADRAARAPDAVAVELGSRRLTYGELAARARRLAGRLRRAGVRSESRVGVLLERSPELVVSLLGILEAGAAYVPLDPASPAERLAFMVRDSGIVLALTREPWTSRLAASGVETMSPEAAAPGGDPPPRKPGTSSRRSASDLAYVMYTSGSTGRPRGVAVSHRAVLRLLFGVRYVELSARRALLHAAPAAFDASTFELWGALLHGGRVVLLSAAIPTARDLRRAVERHRVDTAWLTASLFNAVVNDDASALGGLDQLLIGGEALSVPHVRRYRRLHRSARLVNGYGPTESTTFACCHSVSALPAEPLASIPIGRPIANTEALVLDRGFRPVAIGAPGELLVGGAGLARGYADRPALTGEKLVAHPWSATPGSRLYRTGDRVRLLANGQVDFLGRFDHQVKIRGFRIEPGEVEAALRRHPGVRQAAVTALEEGSTGAPRRTLAAWVVPESTDPGGRPEAASLHEFLSGILPDYMIPSRFAVVGELPRNPSGKIDRGALSALPAARPATGGDATPRSPVEEILAGIWREVLELPRVGIHDDFFHLGGNSLLATQVVSRVRRIFRIELALLELFARPTVSELAASVARALRRRAELEVPPLRPVPRLGAEDGGRRPRAFPLSFAQQRLWFLHRLEPRSPAYNMPASFLFEGRLDSVALEHALSEIVRRHEALRTAFPDDPAMPEQVIEPPSARALPRVDLRRPAADRRLAEARRLAAEDGVRPFDLARPPFRAALLQLDAERHVLLLNQHHIQSDGWSLGVLERELEALYTSFLRRRPSPLPDLPIQYADYAVWQRQALSELFERQLAYWRRQLGPEPTGTRLPTDRLRKGTRSFRGGVCDFRLEADLTAGLRELSRERGVSLYMTLLAGFMSLVGRHAGQREALVGSPIANRNREEIEPLIGFFVNMLALRADLSAGGGEGLSFRRFLERLREVVLGAFTHQDLPFEKLVEELVPERDPSRHPIFQISFALQNAPRKQVRLPGLRIRWLAVERRLSRFDLEVHLWEAPSHLGGRFVYNRDLFDRTSLERLAEHYRNLLRGAARRPEAELETLALWSPAARHQVLREWNDGTPEAVAHASTPFFHELFAAQVRRAPDAAAIVCGEATWSYAELDARARALAWRLHELGVGPESRVGLCWERRPELVAGLVGILKAGGTYVPLEPSYPSRRLAFMTRQAGVRVLVTSDPPPCRLPAALPRVQVPGGDLPAARRGDPPSRLAAENTTYIIYTSGSTGRPKGILITQGGFASFLEWAGRSFPPRQLQGVLASASICFDLSVFDLFVPLTGGGTVVLVENVLSLADLPGGDRVSLITTVPSAMAELVRGGHLPAGVLSVNLGGELLHRDLVDRLYRREAVRRVYNLYGPAEDTVLSTMALVDRRSRELPHLGRPVATTALWVLDRRLLAVPPGVAGEAYVGGSGVSRGYVASPGLTAWRWVPHPFASRPGQRLYRSGDRIRYRPDGTLEFLERLDHQVKLRGYRIELGEIESQLRELPAVEEAVVLKQDRSGDAELPAPRLVAYVVPSAEGTARDARGEEQVAGWRALYEKIYTGGARDEDPASETAGWISSYTDRPVPAAEMEEWIRGTVERIRALRPRRVLEIGCGTGMVLERIAPLTRRYVATDFARSALDRLRERSTRRRLPRLELLERAADDFRGLGAAAFDTVVLNSVVQYFPSPEYLWRVLRGALRVLRPGGALFLGDVRSLPLLELFYASVEIDRAAASDSVAELRRRIRMRREQEAELVVDPLFFAALPRQLEGVKSLRVRPRAGRAANEMVRFRYDVVLRLDAADEDADAPRAAPEVRWTDWRQGGGDLERVRRALRDEPAAAGWARVPNRRLQREIALRELLEQVPETETAAGLRAGAAPAAGIEPDDLVELGRRLGYAVEVSWCRADPSGAFDVLFYRPGSRRGATPPLPAPDETRCRVLDGGTNRPLASRIRQDLPSVLREQLRRKLPEYMVPSAFVVMDALPRLPNRKIDRRALRRRAAVTRRQEIGPAPRTRLEEVLASLWKERLGLEDCGLHDNFFEVGGHSLLLVRIHRRLQEELGRKLPLMDLFRFPTIDALARHLSRAQPEPPSVSSPARPALRPRRSAGGSKIAVIGLDGRFPGARDPHELWRNLRRGVESISVFSPAQLEAAGVPTTLQRDPDYVPARGVVDDIELFDAAFFGITPREAERMDPQQRLFLETVWRALENAGCDPERFPGAIGVFAGASDNGAGRGAATGLRDYLPTHAAYRLNLKGPSVNVQTACSTSLVAVHLACQSLLAGDADVAVAGGVTVRLPQQSGYLYQEGKVLSHDGHCRAFDAAAGGTVAGNGVGVVVLKRWDDAVAADDRIRAVILGSAINNDGAAKVGFRAPGIDGQAAVVAEAQRRSGLDPASIGYVETHGTGTRLGDPVEMTALTRAFRLATQARGFCAVGSVKTNLGHLDNAAGVTGLIKTILALEHGEIPASLHFREPNPEIDFEHSPFYVNAELRSWPRGAQPRRAGVSSFGIGGTNAHLVVEEAPERPRSDAARSEHLLLLSARTPAALEQATDRLAACLEARRHELDLADVAYTLFGGRKHFERRRALVARDADEAIALLKSRSPGQVLTSRRKSRPCEVVFLFPGQASVVSDTERQLYDHEPAFRVEIDRCSELAGRDLAPPGRPVSDGDAQLRLFALDHALGRLWMQWGLRPAAMIGHSLGEYVAACLAGVLSLEDALALVAARARLLERLPAGAMLGVAASGSTLAPLVARRELSIAAVNAPSRCAVSGPVPQIEDLAADLARRGLAHRRLPVTRAFHSPMVEPVVEELASEVARYRLRAPRLPFLSTVTGDWITAAQATDPRYWAEHLRRPVLYCDALGRVLEEPGRVLLEVGPGRALGDLARRHPEYSRAQAVLSSLGTGTAAARHPLLAILGRLWLAGASLSTAGFFAGERRHIVELPSYPFEPQRFTDPEPIRPEVAVTPRRSAIREFRGHLAALRGLASKVRALGPAAGELMSSLAAVSATDFAARPDAAPERAAAGPVSVYPRPDLDVPFVALENDTQRRIAEVWQELLGIEKIGAQDRFLDLGGDSLLAVEVVLRLRRRHRLRLPIEDLYSANIAELAGAATPVDDDGTSAAPGEISRTTRNPTNAFSNDGRKPIR